MDADPVDPPKRPYYLPVGDRPIAVIPRLAAQWEGRCLVPNDGVSSEDFFRALVGKEALDYRVRVDFIENMIRSGNGSKV